MEEIIMSGQEDYLEAGILVGLPVHVLHSAWEYTAGFTSGRGLGRDVKGENAIDCVSYCQSQLLQASRKKEPARNIPLWYL
jgi:hypothetical protein